MGVATAVAIGGLAVSAASTTMSFVQAGKQKKMQREAEAKAAQAMAEARKKLEVNYAKNLSIQKEPYELAREAIMSTGAQAIQAGVESDRGAETTAGKVQMAQNIGQGQVRAEMGQELTDINKQIINEDSRLRDLGVQLDLGEVEGQQLMARDAQEAAAQSTAEGFQGLTSTLQQGLDMVPLFQKNLGAQKSAIGKMNFSNEDFQRFGNVSEKGGLGPAGTGNFTNLDFNKISSMSNPQYKKFVKALTPEQKQMLFQNQQYLNNYNPFNPF